MSAEASRPIFRDRRTDARFRALGYEHASFLDADMLARLSERIHAFGPFGDSGFVDTASMNLSEDVRDEIHDVLVEAFSPITEHLLESYRPVISTIAYKWPGHGSSKGIHRDLQIVEEPEARSVCVWVPLSDVDETNGALRVLPGSHLIPTGWRSVPRSGPHDPVRQLRFDDLTPIPMEAGSALVFDMAMAHGSGANASGLPRVAVAVAFAPAEAPLSMYFRHPDDRVEHFTLSDSSVFRRVDWSAIPEGACSLGPVEDPPPVSNVDELIASSRAAGSTAAKCRPTFRDPHLQRAFEQDGFVVVDLISRRDSQTLHRCYESMEHDHTVPMLFAEGFHTTLYDERPSYRSKVRDAIVDAFSRSLSEFLVDYDVLFANFTVKLAGGGAVPEHVDWTFVDESVGPSVTIWCPLHDVDAEHGALGVVRGSHRRVSTIRAANHRHYGQQAAAAEDLLDRAPVPLRMGQAIVLDNRSVHFSPPNRSGSSRIAAAVVAAPAELAPLHYWFDDDDLLHRLEVGPDFWLNYIPGGDPRRLAGVLDDRVVEGVATM